MINFEKTRKYRTDNIFLLLLFIIGLGFAALFCLHKSSVTFGDPISLPYLGISLELPRGAGWESTYQWEFSEEENAFLLDAYQLLGSSSAIASMSCRYEIASSHPDANAFFEFQTDNTNNTLISRSQSSHNSLDFEQAQMKSTHNGIHSLYAFASLPNGHNLVIELLQYDNNNQNIRIMQHILETCKYNPDPAIETGKQILQKIQTNSIASLLPDTPINEYFLITTPRQRTPIGFTIDVLIRESDSQPPINVASTSFLQSPFRLETFNIFNGDETFENFYWRSEKIQSKHTFSHGTQMQLVDANQLLIEKPGSANILSLHVKSPICPDALITPVLRYIQQNNVESVIFDLIMSDGTISPVLLETVESNASQTVITITILSQSATSTVTLDANGNVTEKQYSQKNLVLLFKPSSPKELLNLFPRKRNLIVNTNYSQPSNAF